jgi:hypothetical protein
MKYLKKYNEGFKESKFIRTETYKDYVRSGFIKPDLDEMLDRRNFITKKINLANEDERDLLNKELLAIDYILKRHY